MHACSAPPMYWSTGIQYSAFFLSKGNLSFFESQYLRKYQEESIKVSIVSVSLLASPLHLGHLTFTNDLLVLRGFPIPNFMSSGRTTGKSFSGTGTNPHL